MKFVVIDSTTLPGITSGPGSPAYFSRFLIDYLTEHGHEVTVANGFDTALCASADVVWADWCTDEAYRAADSGVCKRLLLRLKGFDVHGPLDRMRWENVDALVYESPHVRRLAEQRYPSLSKLPSIHVILSGLDLKSIPYKKRFPGHVVALVGRAVADKGYQLAFEWAHRRTDLSFHMTCSLGDSNPRFVGYLNYAKPSNVTLHGTVDDPVSWLQRIRANYLLSTSIQEAPGYAIAEAAALGIKPLILAAPGIEDHWPATWQWRTLANLDALIMRPDYDSRSYRSHVEQHFDAEKLSKQFADLALNIPPRNVADGVARVRRQTEAGVVQAAATIFQAIRTAVEKPSNLDVLDSAITDFRAHLEPHGQDVEHRYGAALGLAIASFNHGDLPRAELWACRALLDYPRADVFVLLGEIAAARGDTQNAIQWMKAANVVEDVPGRHRYPSLVDKRAVRLLELQR